MPRSLHAAIALVFLGCLPVSPAMAASFDCNRTDLKADEKAICEHRDLNDLDVKMVTTFDLLSGLLAMGNRGELQDQQTAWLKSRQACNAEIACIKTTYEERLKQLMKVYDNIERPR